MEPEVPVRPVNSLANRRINTMPEARLIAQRDHPFVFPSSPRLSESLQTTPINRSEESLHAPPVLCVGIEGGWRLEQHYRSPEELSRLDRPLPDLTDLSGQPEGPQPLPGVFEELTTKSPVGRGDG